MMAIVNCHNERFLIDPTNAVWQHHKAIGWLLLHGFAGGWQDCVAVCVSAADGRARGRPWRLAWPMTVGPNHGGWSGRWRLVRAEWLAKWAA
jgi:hypothetical protein